jgi:RimJ/RimL family protein N-acetyltransferase
MRFADIRKHPDGVALAWQLLLERPVEANISHQEMPTIDEHTAYVRDHPYRVWLVIESDVVQGAEFPYRELVGTIALTKQNEISIAILKSHQRRGYARSAIQEVMGLYPPLGELPGLRGGDYLANVAPGNLPSHALFTGLGAKLVQLTYRFGG